MKRKVVRVKLSRFFMTFLLSALIIFSFSCRNENRQGDDETREMQEDTLREPLETQTEARSYSGNINPLNSKANADREVSGNVELIVERDLLRIFVYAEGLSPDMMHMQHLQISEVGGDMPCPGDDADTNDDGVVDVSEVSQNDQGRQMVPLHMGPSTLEVNNDTYPRSNINGELQFDRTVSLDSLRDAVRTEYGIEELDLTNFTYVIQGVSEDAEVPQTAQSVSQLEAHQTIPVGCAKLEEE